MSTSFEQQYQITPNWLRKKLDRRKLLKSAAGASAIVASMPLMAITDDVLARFVQERQSHTWQTLDAVQQHLLPSSESGPGAKEINAAFYLYFLVHEQPTDQEEIAFIFQGVDWLNDYTDKRFNKTFITLNQDEKQQVLTGISRSQAGRSWLSMMILNIYEAMLAPPSYGGNPEGIGWQWLEHQMGFPLPEKGQRYFELPPRSKAMKQKTQAAGTIAVHQLIVKRRLGTDKA